MTLSEGIEAGRGLHTWFGTLDFSGKPAGFGFILQHRTGEVTPMLNGIDLQKPSASGRPVLRVY